MRKKTLPLFQFFYVLFVYFITLRQAYSSFLHFELLVFFNFSNRSIHSITWSRDQSVIIRIVRSTSTAGWQLRALGLWRPGHYSVHTPPTGPTGWTRNSCFYGDTSAHTPCHHWCPASLPRDQLLSVLVIYGRSLLLGAWQLNVKKYCWWERWYQRNTKKHVRVAKGASK